MVHLNYVFIVMDTAPLPDPRKSSSIDRTGPEPPVHQPSISTRHRRFQSVFSKSHFLQIVFRAKPLLMIRRGLETRTSVPTSSRLSFWSVIQVFIILFSLEPLKSCLNLGRIEQNDPLNLDVGHDPISHPVFQQSLGDPEGFCHLCIPQSLHVCGCRVRAKNVLSMCLICS